MAITQAGTPTHVTNTGSSGATAAMDSSVGSPTLLVDGTVGPATAYTNGKDSKALTWTNPSPQVNSAGSVACNLPYVLSPGSTGSGHTFTSDLSIFYCAIFAAAFAGVSALDQADGVSDTGSGTTHPASSGALTPGSAGCLIVSVIAFSANPGTLTPPTGMTLLDQSATGTYLDGAMAFEIQTGTTARTPVWGTTNSVRSCAKTLIFTAAGGGGASIVPLISQHRHRR